MMNDEVKTMDTRFSPQTVNLLKRLIQQQLNNRSNSAALAQDLEHALNELKAWRPHHHTHHLPLPLECSRRLPHLNLSW